MLWRAVTKVWEPDKLWAIGILDSQSILNRPSFITLPPQLGCWNSSVLLLGMHKVQAKESLNFVIKCSLEWCCHTVCTDIQQIAASPIWDLQDRLKRTWTFQICGAVFSIHTLPSQESTPFCHCSYIQPQNVSPRFILYVSNSSLSYAYAWSSLFYTSSDGVLGGGR